MPDNLMYIPNGATQCYTFCRLQLVVEKFSLMNQRIKNLIKVPKVVKPTNKKMFIKLWGLVEQGSYFVNWPFSALERFVNIWRSNGSFTCVANGA